MGHSRWVCLLQVCMFFPVLAASESGCFPVWDGKESVEAYAREIGLTATKRIDLGGDVCIELVLVPSGEFIMGTIEPEPRWGGGGIAAGAGLGVVGILGYMLLAPRKRRFKYRLRWFLAATLLLALSVFGFLRLRKAQKRAVVFDREAAPAFRAMVPAPIYMSKFEITEKQYRQLMRGAGRTMLLGNLPVADVSWHDANDFCKHAEAVSGYRFRLPTEVEWEYACRAGSETKYFSGSSIEALGRMGWYEDNSGNERHAVGQKTANAFDLYDMHGNMAEWCSDKWYPDYAVHQPKPPVVMGTIPDWRVVRGGYFQSEADYCASRKRAFGSENDSDWTIGFRVVVDIDEGSAR